MFNLVSKYTPSGDQPGAIEKLVKGIEEGKKHQVLLGATGTGKTFTIANVIKKVGRPTLVLAHNKTLAGQLYSELKELFPNNRVEYFVSYYDYYQPEAYVPSSDTYIEKDSSINDEIDELRHSATSALISRDDVIVVASVSCIYGIGEIEEYKKKMLTLNVGDIIEINSSVITDTIEKGYIPVISTIAYGTDGQPVYNINADIAAAEIAIALKAQSLILLTDTRGVMLDVHDENTLLSVIHTNEVDKLVENGTIVGGMIPKVKCCVQAVEGGIAHTHIIDGSIAHSILVEMFSDEGIGTMFLQ